MKLTLIKHIIGLLSLCIYLISMFMLGGCSKDIVTQDIDPGTFLSFNISGINEYAASGSNSGAQKSARKEGLGGLYSTGSSSVVHSEVIDLGGVDAKVTVEESGFRNTSTSSTNNAKAALNPKEINIDQASLLSTTPLPVGRKYRIILYAAGTNTVLSNTLGTSGTRLDVPVEKGRSYDWSVISYNDDNDPGTATTTIATDHRDLLHAKSSAAVTIGGTTGDGQDIQVNIPVVLNHILSQIVVEVNTQNYPATITSLTGTLGSTTYFQSGTFNVKTGAITGAATAPTAAAIPFTGTGTGIATKSYYTVGTSTINPFQVNLGALTINAAGTPISLPSARTYNFANVTPAAGKSIKAKIEFLSIADFSCANTPVAFGTYTVDKNLDSYNYIESYINVTKPGNVHLATIDKNGMKFDSGIVPVTAGLNTIRLSATNSTTVLVNQSGVNVLEGSSATSKPNDSEEGSAANIANRMNNQSGSYTIINVFNESPLCDPVLIDVKAKFMDGNYMNTATATGPLAYTAQAGNSYWPANNALYATEGAYSNPSYSPTDGRIQTDFANVMSFNSSYVSLAPQYRCLWFTFAKNVSTQPITMHKGSVTGTADYQPLIAYTTKNWTYTVASSNLANNARIGSLDAYRNGDLNSPQPTVGTTLVDGAHGAGSNMQLAPVYYAEVTNSGLVVKIGAYYYKYRLMWSSKRGAGNNPYTTETKQALALYGITKTNPAVFVPLQTQANENGTSTNNATYTGDDGQIGDRNIRSYNP